MLAIQCGQVKQGWGEGAGGSLAAVFVKTQWLGRNKTINAVTEKNDKAERRSYAYHATNEMQVLLCWAEDYCLHLVAKRGGVAVGAAYSYAAVALSVWSFLKQDRNSRILAPGPAGLNWL